MKEKKNEWIWSSKSPKKSSKNSWVEWSKYTQKSNQICRDKIFWIMHTNVPQNVSVTLSIDSALCTYPQSNDVRLTVAMATDENEEKRICGSGNASQKTRNATWFSSNRIPRWWYFLSRIVHFHHHINNILITFIPIFRQFSFDSFDSLPDVKQAPLHGSRWATEYHFHFDVFSNFLIWHNVVASRGFTFYLKEITKQIFKRGTGGKK